MATQEDCVLRCCSVRLQANALGVARHYSRVPTRNSRTRNRCGSTAGSKSSVMHRGVPHTISAMSSAARNTVDVPREPWARVTKSPGSSGASGHAAANGPCGRRANDSRNCASAITGPITGQWSLTEVRMPAHAPRRFGVHVASAGRRRSM